MYQSEMRRRYKIINGAIKPIFTKLRIDDAMTRREVLSHKKIQSRREIKGAKKRVKATCTYTQRETKRGGKDLRILFARWAISRILKISGPQAFMCARDAYAGTNCCTASRKSNFHPTAMLNMSTI